ncbi:recombinase family protein [Streptomyces sp. QTS52]
MPTSPGGRHDASPELRPPRIGARVSTNSCQDLTAQRERFIALGVVPENIHVDHGLTGTHRSRPGLRESFVAVRAGDTLTVTSLDRSLPDARGIHDELSLGGSIYDPADPVGQLLFNVLGMTAEFEADLIRMRTREGMAMEKANGKPREATQGHRREAPPSPRYPRGRYPHPDGACRAVRHLPSHGLPRTPTRSATEGRHLAPRKTGHLPLRFTCRACW